MLFDYKYSQSSSINNSSTSTEMSFAPDLLREPTFFVGKLNNKIAFREAISALHEVVVSDLRFQPKDKEAYKLWAAEQEKIWLSDYMADFQIEKVRERIQELKAALNLVHKEKSKVMGPFNKAKSAYFDYLYKNDKDAWYVLDPVITVHPDEVFFECFSKDESTYGKLSCNYNIFKEISDFKCGTTNIDYSQGLYNEFQKIRDYKETEFKIDPSGFETKTSHEALYKEVKIDLPDSWVQGFLQVSSAMTLPATEFELHPMDVFSLCQYMRRFKEKKGPRALRFILEPDKPIKAVFEPLYDELCFHRSIFKGNQAKTIRVWGRRRLLVLERLIPLMQSLKVVLLGSGLPSFFIANMGDMAYTLGLSGWTKNDWSTAGNFDLMAPRTQVDLLTQEKVFEALKTNWFATSDHLAQKLNLDSAVVLGSLAAYTQAGRVIYDMNSGVYRLRELTQEPLNVKELRFSSPQEAVANQFITQNQVKITTTVQNNCLQIKGKVKDRYASYSTLAVLDTDNRLIEGQCDCNFFRSNQLRKGPCEHILATRMALHAKAI